MHRLATGLGLLLATIVTGFVAGSTKEERIRSVTQAVTRDRPADPPRASEERETVPARKAGGGGAASSKAQAEESPEASDLVERMRHPFPAIAGWQAEEIRKYHRDYKQKLHAHGMNIASVLLEDRESQRRAVARMRELRRERTEFMRLLLGRETWSQWKDIEQNGGRNVNELLRELQKRN